MYAPSLPIEAEELQAQAPILLSFSVSLLTCGNLALLRLDRKSRMSQDNKHALFHTVSVQGLRVALRILSHGRIRLYSSLLALWF